MSYAGHTHAMAANAKHQSESHRIPHTENFYCAYWMPRCEAAAEPTETAGQESETMEAWCVAGGKSAAQLLAKAAEVDAELARLRAEQDEERAALALAVRERNAAESALQQAHAERDALAASFRETAQGFHHRAHITVPGVSAKVFTDCYVQPCVHNREALASMEKKKE